MTLRVWVAELDSVAFNTDRDRDLVAIRGLPDEAARLGQSLAAFAKNQGSIMAPMSAVDGERMGAINVLNADPLAEMRRVPIVDFAPPQAIGGDPVAAMMQFCVSCGAKVTVAHALYCGSCGAKLL